LSGSCNGGSATCACAVESLACPDNTAPVSAAVKIM
jgi:hypothetical protein